MSESFICGSWFESDQTEVGFELSNESGEQYFFCVSAEIINQNITLEGCHALDKFKYYEENMLAMALELIDADYLEEGQDCKVNQAMFRQYYIS